MSAKAEGIIPFGAMSAFILLTAIGTHFTAKQPAHAIVARVVEVTTRGARFPRDVVIARAPHAIQTEATVPYPEETACRVGDDVDAKQAGISLVIDTHTCRRPQRSSTSRP